MTKLVHPSAIEQELELSKGYIGTVASAYKKKFGKYPKWWVQIGHRQSMTDYYKFMKYYTLYDRAKLYCNSKLYWVFRAAGYSDSDISRTMAENSKKFNSVQGWQGFFCDVLFSNPEINSSFYGSKVEEFIKIGSRYIYDKMKKGELVFSKECEFFGRNI